ncbi:MAG: hypothetical protein WC538_22120 [Thermoanaerobaculia bacterium]|jgi:hypothetical protein
MKTGNSFSNAVAQAASLPARKIKKPGIGGNAETGKASAPVVGDGKRRAVAPPSDVPSAPPASAPPTGRRKQPAPPDNPPATPPTLAPIRRRIVGRRG